ncbi:class I tRNA ligase family protein, partial [Candidatus Pacebacteria bacterium]|nr:class I tRNA ligase family protein [Candidatus Paceibacterota bacterium]
MSDYDHKEIEKKWQKRWEEDKIYQTPDSVEGKENEYILVEFPYPSGNLHVGHWYAFAVSDIYARFRRMQGKNVMFPIGFDAFGLPAERAAIKHDLNPRDWTYKNMEVMREQLKSMGAMFDWSRELATCDPSYYKWTQFLFLELFKAGLVEKKTTLVNWDPVDKTVLANEQVLADGTADRSGAKVEKKELEQWGVKITDYADRLIDDLDELDWPEEIKTSQKNWIGRSEGSKIDFEIKGLDKGQKIKVFTTRADTLFGVTYLVLAPEHKLINDLKEKVENFGEIEKYQKIASDKSDIDRTNETKEKTGVELKGLKAINPVNKEEIPIFVADYVLANYGTGAIMAVPAHDDRDNEFAKKHNLEIRTVIEPETGEKRGKEEYRRAILALVENKETGEVLSINWGKDKGGNLLIGGGVEDGEDLIETAKREIQEETGYTDVEFVSKSENIHHHYFAVSKNVNRKIEATGLHFVINSEEKVEPQLDEEEKGHFTVEWVHKDELRKNIMD